MKLYEILAESQEIKEAPMGFLSKAGHTIASKLGSKTSAAKLDVGNRANEIFNSFRDYALRAGLDLSAVTTKDLSAWFKKQGLPTPNLGAPNLTYDLNNKEVMQGIFKGSAQKSFGAATSTQAPLGQKYNVTPGAAPAGGGGSANFNQIKAAIASLTPKQKAQLKAMI